MIAIDRAKGVPPGSLYLKPVPGGLLGETADRELFRSRPGITELRISTGALADNLEAYARTAMRNRLNPGELARPRELGIARIGTFYETAAGLSGCANFRTGLRLVPANVILVYVDRAGTLQGARYVYPYIMEYQLDFPGAGIYAIAMHSRGMVVTQRVVNVSGKLTATVRRAHCA